VGLNSLKSLNLTNVYPNNNKNNKNNKGKSISYNLRALRARGQKTTLFSSNFILNQFFLSQFLLIRVGTLDTS
jgi:hypothetical protein